MSSAVMSGACSGAGLIEVDGLTKRYGRHDRGRRPELHGPARARDRLPRPERRGQDHHDADDPRPGPRRPPARPGRRPRYPTLSGPLREVGALLDAKAVHGGRTAWTTCCARAEQRHRAAAGSTRCSSWPGSRRSPAGGPRVLARHEASGSASPPRCSATPPVLMFDEPVNGLDPEGIRWIRELAARRWPPRAARSWSPAT